MADNPAARPETTEEWEVEMPGEGAGAIIIGDDVLAHIVARAASEVDGVEIDSRFALTDLLGRREKEHVKGISVRRNAEDNSVAIVCSVRMAYGQDMYDLAVNLRRHIKSTVEKMTRVIVHEVSVRIVGLVLSERERSQAMEENTE